MFKTLRTTALVASTLALAFGGIEVLFAIASVVWPLAALASEAPGWLAILALGIGPAGAGVLSALEIDRLLDEDGARALVAAGVLLACLGSWLWLHGLSPAIALAGIGYLAAAALHARAGNPALPRAVVRGAR